MNMMMQKLMNSTLIVAAAAALTACGQANMPATMPQSPVMMQAQSIERQQQDLIVRFNPDASRHELFNFNEKYGLQTKGYIHELNAYIVGLRQPLSNQNELHSLVALMNSESVTLFVELNQVVQVAPVPYDMVTSPIFSN